MENRLHIEMRSQPDELTCGPTCLHSIYRYYNDPIRLRQVIQEVPSLLEGGTLASLLACHALKRGYRATIYTYKLQMFDPTWFLPDGQAAPGIAQKLRLQLRAKKSRKMKTATRAYLEFLRLGGILRLEDLTPALIRKFLNQKAPVLTGLSATFLYRCAREWRDRFEDVKGHSTGHFVLLCGYDRDSREVLVADPFLPNPVSKSNFYPVSMDRLIGAILLGVLTYDANLLLIQPSKC